MNKEELYKYFWARDLSFSDIQYHINEGNIKIDFPIDEKEYNSFCCNAEMDMNNYFNRMLGL